MNLILVTGDRNWTDYDIIARSLKKVLTSKTPWLAIVHGDCPTGADRIARKWCEYRGVPEFRCPANWKFYNRSAGPIRNGWMLLLPITQVLAFHENIDESKGTKNMIKQSLKAKLPCALYDGTGWRNPARMGL